MTDDAIRAAAQAYRDAVEGELKYADAKLEPGKPVPTAKIADLMAAHDLVQETQRAYYKLLKDVYGWEPPAGINL